MNTVLVQYVADALMNAWFPKRKEDPEWVDSEDGKSWAEISILDAEVAVNAIEKFYGDDLK